MLYFWVIKLVLWVGYFLLRLVPFVGSKLSGAYESSVFEPVVEDVSVTDVRATLVDDPSSLVVEYDLENESWVELGVAGIDIRVGLREEGGTIRNVVWTPSFDELPRNIVADRLTDEESATVGFEYLAGPVEEGTTIHLSGMLVFQYSFTLRGHRFEFGKRSFRLPDEAVTVEPE